MKILLVDDDTSIIQALLPALKSLPGHEVHVALSAEKALERAPAVGGIDVLVTDVVMEPMDGFSLREQLEAWYPGLRTLFISGYDLSGYADRVNGARLLTKPFRVEELLENVQAVIGGRAAEPEPAPAIEPEAVAVEEPAAYAAVEETLDPVVHSAAPHGGSPSVPETQGAADLYAGGFEAAPNIAAHALMPVAEPLYPVEEPAPVEAAAVYEPEPPVPVPVSVPVARPVAMKPTTKTVSGIHPAPTVKAVARPATPVATPKAVATPRATAVPGALSAPKAVAQPSGIPTVRAAATAPTAVPVARAVVATPSGVPVAKPVMATPTATPVARPVAATPTAVPVARPVAATPVAVPVVKAVAAVAVPVVKAVAAVPVARPAVASPSAVPVARPASPSAPVAKAAAPKAVAARPAVATPQAPTIRAVAPPMHADVNPPPPKRESHASSAFLIGQTIGGYKIVSQLGEGRWGSVFSAVQTSINRKVGLKVLAPDHAADEAQQQRFTADARAKAHVQHPGILSVYEAGSADNWTFYTQEYVDGQNLEEMAAAGRRLDEPTALKLLKTAADGLAYLAKSNIPHTPFQPSDVYLGADGQPRLSNLATQLADQPIVVAQEIESLGRALLSVIDAGPSISTAMRALLGRTLRSHANPITDWNVLLQGVKALEPKVIPVEAAKISAQERAALATVEKARLQQKRSLLYNVGALVSLLVLVGVAVWFVWGTNERVLEEQIHIPAGEFIFGPDSKPATTGEYWIDRYEVTIGQYAKFVREIDKDAGMEHAFDHPKQPKNLGHIPEYWNIYYAQAHKGGAAHSAPISLNSPMLTVTWWDAYAYARWLGRELPTEMEWEKAARGEKGFAFPWGDEPDPKRANTNADYDERHPGAKGGVDGFNYWGDVDKQKKDKSPYGVIGMAGNVSEWVVDWVDRFPIIKGGNYSIGLQPMSARIANRLPEDAQESIGFRTVTHKAPESK